MKIKYYSMRNIEEALEELQAHEEGKFHSDHFLKALSKTKIGERENVVIETIEPE